MVVLDPRIIVYGVSGYGALGPRTRGAKGNLVLLPISPTSFPNERGVPSRTTMDKTELIECIREINKTAKPEFLARFCEKELRAYLEHLMELNLEEAVVAS